MTEAQRWEIGPAAGRLEVHTLKEGLLSRMGHDLTIEVGAWSGHIELVAASDGAVAARVTVEVDATSLRVVAPPDERRVPRSPSSPSARSGRTVRTTSPAWKTTFRAGCPGPC